MWKIYLLEFIVVVVVSILWANAIEKTDWNDDDDDMPFP